MILGIEASNIRGGGGVTHLVELLRAADPGLHGFSKVYIWAIDSTLNQIEDRPWLFKMRHPFLNKSTLHRFFWQKFRFLPELKSIKCHLLFVPGGTYLGSFKPFVTMSQNLLPFAWQEIRQYGLSLRLIRFLLLRITQTLTFRRAAGVIFLTQHAREIVLDHRFVRVKSDIIVPHGIDQRFFHKPRRQKPIKQYNDEHPFTILYVSFIGIYKHQWQVVKAVSLLRQAGLPLQLELVGPAVDKKAIALLTEAISKEDPERKFVRQYTDLGYLEINNKYKTADVFVFASSCETFGQILTEAMAAGLPIACSKLSAMPELLGNGGLYFDPRNIAEIVQALQTLITSADARKKAANLAHRRAKAFSWRTTATKTFAYLAACAAGQIKHE